MQLARPALALHSRRFGRGQVRLLGTDAEYSAPAPAVTLSDEARLFATTFAAGFLFVTLFMA